MKNISIVTLSVLCFCFQGCKSTYNQKSLKKMLLSGTVEDKIDASNYIAETRDTAMIQDLMKDGCNANTSMDYSHKGMTVYYVKMLVLKEITDLEPPEEITYEPDSTIYRFYLDAAKKKGWIWINWSRLTPSHRK